MAAGGISGRTTGPRLRRCHSAAEIKVMDVAVKERD
jgi:hypothetical protein